MEYTINPETETLVLGTFNPETEANISDFFYGRHRNHLWTLIPSAFGEASLKGKSKAEKITFIEKYKIDFMDLIIAVDVDEDQVANYNDSYINKRVSEWKDVISVIKTLPKLKRICLTRKSFGDIPNIKYRINKIKDFCDTCQISFHFLTTPARAYRADKQEEWSNYFNTKNLL